MTEQQNDAEKAKLAELESDLAAERAAHTATQLKHTVTMEFLRCGGRASAVDFVAAEAAKVFAMDGGKLTTKEFSATNPAEPLSLTEWMDKQARVADYLFQPSRGGGARGSAPGARFGTRSNQKVLRNPTAQELGQHAADIASGKTKVEHR